MLLDDGGLKSDIEQSEGEMHRTPSLKLKARSLLKLPVSLEVTKNRHREIQQRLFDLAVFH